MTVGFFITGTDTGVGKTWVSLALMDFMKKRGMSVQGMKPIAAGCHLDGNEWVNEDAVLLRKNSSRYLPYSEINPYALKAAVSPHLAAKQERRTIVLDDIFNVYRKISMESESIIVEGAGGWFVPLNDVEKISDLAQKINLPIILVVGIKLGCLNHARLTLDAIQRSQLACAGWVGSIIDPGMSCLNENIETLKSDLNVPCFGILPFMQSYNSGQACSAFDGTQAILEWL